MSACSATGGIRRSASRASRAAGEEAILRKEGNRLVNEPVPPRSLSVVLARLQPLDEDFPPIGELPATPVDL
jgi:antitoxin VapB